MKEWKKTGRPYAQDVSIPAQKILRCLSMIRALEEDRMTVPQMARKFDISERTVYRYVALLEECGFMIDQDFNHRFFIAKP